ncbi:MFS general substrate transporter [Bimuria novae-zelandiae CBS 107.79]|uniref:MFS general substrate transporter n=1 Tax=Bimuria novae-zelandiae CBS 107.79 TaxID=1447943 RepID=A0A6A5VUT2_9PLEO|nr:MFS general substrate transporter [Bimuria novae-zelandiae CBS 107.79]
MIASTILGFDTLVASWASSVYSSAVDPVSQEFHVGTVVSLLGLTLYICGFATGPLACAPLSEQYGRKYPITIAAFIFRKISRHAYCAFFAGVMASCPLAVVGGAFSDLFGNETRGIAIASFSAMVSVGPFISPIVAAFITESYLGWRWTQYITGIMGALATVLDVLFLEETYQKTLLQKCAQFIRSETENWAIHHVFEEELLDFNDLVHNHLALPSRLLFLEPIVFLITLYTAFIYGILYLFLEAYPVVFAEYRGISSSVSTLMYIGLIIGVLIGGWIIIAFEPRYNRLLRVNNGIPVPEERLPPMMIGFLTGAGIMTIFLQALNYLVDAYLVAATSSIAANTFLRSFFGAGLLATQFFHNLGVDWAGSLIRFLAVAFMPIPFLFYIFCERLRKMSRYTFTDLIKPQGGDEEAPSGKVE